MMTRKRFTAVISLVTALAGSSALAHEGHHSPVPWQACENKQLDAPCQYSNASQDQYRGSCREVNQQLMCIRNQPIVKACTDRALCATSADTSAFSPPAGAPVENTAT